MIDNIYNMRDNIHVKMVVALFSQLMYHVVVAFFI